MHTDPEERLAAAPAGTRPAVAWETWLLSGLLVLQWLLFSSFVEREVAWSPFLNGDANAYLGLTYILFDAFLKGEGIPSEFLLAQHGIAPMLLSAGLYLLFGASRLSALAPNLLLFLLFQVVTYWVVTRLTGARLVGLVAVGLLLCLQIPFQLNPNLLLNIAEYQREFLVFSLFGVYLWLVIASDSFDDLRLSLLAGLVGGIAGRRLGCAAEGDIQRLRGRLAFRKPTTRLSPGHPVQLRRGGARLQPDADVSDRRRASRAR